MLVIAMSIGLFLGLQSIPTLEHYGLGFFTESRWLPSQDILGIAAVALGTVEVAAMALMIAVPLALATALFITDRAPARLRSVLITLVDLMAAVPGIVFGLWVLLVVQPHATHVTHWMSKVFGWFPPFNVRTDVDFPIWNQAPGYPAYAGSAAIASIAVAAMIFPMATSVMREVFAEAPVGEKEAALALGRALGETISVVMVITQTFEIKFRVLEAGTSTVSSLIATGYKEASPAQLSALLTAGFLLFVTTMIVNGFAAVVVSRARSGAESEI